MIGAPVHEKYIVHAINTCDKRYQKEKICIVWTPEVDDSTERMEAHTMVWETKSSWAITWYTGSDLTKNTIKERRNRRWKKGDIIYKIWKMCN